MWPEITFDAPLGWAKVRHERDFWRCDNGTRVESRKQCPEFDASGYTGSYAYPAGFKLFTLPKSGYRYLPYTPGFYYHLRDPRINTKQASDKIIILNQGLFNTKPNRDRGFIDAQPIPEPPWEQAPLAECLTSTYAIHKILERKSGSTKIETFKLSADAPDPDVYNPRTAPWLYYVFMAIDDYGNLSYTTGYKCHIPLISIDGYAWIEDEKVEFLSEYPEEPMGTYTNGTVSLTNQGMINLFKAAFADAYWDVVTRAGLEWIAADRPATYEGPTVGEMTLAYDEKVLLRDQVILAGYSEPPITPPAGGVDVSQAVQILQNAKESGIATVDSIQTALDILEVPE